MIDFDSDFSLGFSSLLSLFSVRSGRSSDKRFQQSCVFNEIVAHN